MSQPSGPGPSNPPPPPGPGRDEFTPVPAVFPASCPAGPISPSRDVPSGRDAGETEQAVDVRLSRAPAGVREATPAGNRVCADVTDRPVPHHRPVTREAARLGSRAASRQPHRHAEWLVGPR